MTRQHNHILAKIFWSLAPLFWGIVVWVFAYGPGGGLQVPSAVRLLVGIILLSLYFFRTFESARLHNAVTLFGYPVWLPDWRYIVGITVAGLAPYMLFATWGTYPILDSMVLLVGGSSCVEELLARTVFVRYHFRPGEFIFFNILSACAFTLMHAGFEAVIPSLYELFFLRGHFAFSFMLGIVAYKTERIETTILLHMASNFLRYTLPVLILGQELLIVALIFQCTELLLLAGLSIKTIEGRQFSSASKLSCSQNPL